ncbi:MAG: hypothetical protein AAF628_13695 [Planctomycetota bacterium]
MPTSALLLSLLLAPQGAMFADAPISLSVDVPTAFENNLSTSNMYYRGTGWSGVPGEHPDPPSVNKAYFSTQTGANVPWTGTELVIDAFSTNVNYLAVTPAGVIDKSVVHYTYAGLTLSVEKGTVGETGSVFRDNPGDPTGADVYEYMFPGSEGVKFPNQLVLATDEDDLVLEGTDPEIISMALYVPALLQSPGVVPTLSAAFESVVFSLTHSSAQDAPPEWFQSPQHQGQQAKEGGALLRCDWVTSPGSNPGYWQGPYLYKTAQELGIQGQELTAVAWHKRFVGGAEQNYIAFSTDSLVLDQILFKNLGTSGPTVPLSYRDGSGTVTVTCAIKIQVGVERVDALSAFDPREDGAKLFSEESDLAPGALLESTAFRNIDPTGLDNLIAVGRNPAGAVQANWLMVIGNWPDATPTLHGVLPMPAAGNNAVLNVGNVPAAMFGIPYTLQWLATDDVHTGPITAWSGKQRVIL